MKQENCEVNVLWLSLLSPCNRMHRSLSFDLYQIKCGRVHPMFKMTMWTGGCKTSGKLVIHPELESLWMTQPKFTATSHTYNTLHCQRKIKNLKLCFIGWVGVEAKVLTTTLDTMCLFTIMFWTEEHEIHICSSMPKDVTWLCRVESIEPHSQTSIQKPTIYAEIPNTIYMISNTSIFQEVVFKPQLHMMYSWPTKSDINLKHNKCLSKSELDMYGST